PKGHLHRMPPATSAAIGGRNQTVRPVSDLQLLPPHPVLGRGPGGFSQGESRLPGRCGKRCAGDGLARVIQENRRETAEAAVRRGCSQGRATQAYSLQYVEENEREQTRRARESAVAVDVHE